MIRVFLPAIAQVLLCVVCWITADGIFASMRVQTDRVNMPNYITPIICIWVTGE